MLSTITDYALRVQQGKELESRIAKNWRLHLEHMGCRMDNATAREDMTDKIDRWITNQKGRRLSVQIKGREGGNDLIFEIVKNLRTWENGRDLNCKSDLYLHVDRCGKGWLYWTHDIKRRAAELMEVAKSDLGEYPDQNKWNFKACEMKVTTDNANGNRKLMAFFAPCYFSVISTFEHLYD